MSKFIRIENPVSVLPSVELMRTLGASSSRDNEARIGQFGSGFPYSLALLARNDLLHTFKICLGKDVYTFYLEEHKSKTSRNDDFNIFEICMKKQNGGTWNLNIDVRFGAIDWRDVTMAAREFVSNAYDGTDNPRNVNIEYVESNQCRAKEGAIRVYIEATDELRNYIDNINNYFLMGRSDYRESDKIIRNPSHDDCRIYRRGVLVGTFGEHSLYNYNFKDISLNESRLITRSDACDLIAQAITIAPQSVKELFLIHMQNNDKDYWDINNVDMYYLDPKNHYMNKDETEKHCNSWKNAYLNVFGPRIATDNPIFISAIQAMGYDHIMFSEEHMQFLRSVGIRTDKDVLTKNQLENRDIFDPTKDMEKALSKVWKAIDRAGMTQGKDIPILKCFYENMKEGAQRLGFYDDGTVYINKDISVGLSDMLMQTTIEECAHYITGFKDMTRDFQDWAFRLACALMK